MLTKTFYLFTCLLLLSMMERARVSSVPVHRPPMGYPDTREGNRQQRSIVSSLPDHKPPMGYPDTREVSSVPVHKPPMGYPDKREGFCLQTDLYKLDVGQSWTKMD
ncbi:uncharacterized protein [Montipora foliosa]|uniref:uncharacterized protein isoform X3 n=1 Tax=Montipora foliosa TaxID=591990 RepID=UPI0035F1A6A8